MTRDRQTSPERAIEVRRYSNRRLYDTTRSRYVTLSEIHRLIRDGNRVRIRDSKTGEDISGRVLAQVVLDCDGRKLGVFPIELWHQLIRVNEKIVLEFVDFYFSRPMQAFFESRRYFDAYFRSMLGAGFAGIPRPLAPPQSSAGHNGDDNSIAADDAAPDDDLKRMVRDLQEQVAKLQEQIDSLQAIEVHQ